MSKKTILGFFDTETTELIKAYGTNLDLQPYIIEVCIIQTDEEFNILNEYEALIKPPENVSVPYHITKITNINDQMLKNQKPFKKHFKICKQMIEESSMMIAQNIMFDFGMFGIECQRLDKYIDFPDLFCTVEQSLHFEGYRLNSKELYEYATKKKAIKSHHRAKADVLALIDYYKFVQKYLPKHLKVKK